MQTTQANGKRLKVMLMAPWFGPAYGGGAPRLFDMLASKVRALDVVVLANSLDAKPEEIIEYDNSALADRGYRIDRRPMPEMIFSASAARSRVGKVLYALKVLYTRHRSLRKAISAHRPDVLIAGNSYVCGWLWNRLPAKSMRVNYVHGEEMTMDLEYGPVSRWFKRNQLKSLREADLNIAVSQYSADQVVSLAGASAAKVIVLPNAVDPEIFFPPADREELRQRFGWAGHTVLLTIARLIPRKGIDQVLRALQQAKGLPPDWLYVIAGRGPVKEQLESLAKELGLLDRVRFVGYVAEQDLPLMYGAADVFIQPNRCINGDTEGFGIVFIEASACGTPVIGGVAGGTGDAISDDVSGLRVDGDSVDEVRVAIERLLGDAALRQQMAADGLERVRAEFTAEVFARKFETIIQRAWLLKQAS